MARIRNYSKDTPHLVTKVAEYGIRRAIRPLIGRPKVPFVALLRVDDPENVFLYQEAANRLLDVGETYDLEGRDTTAVWQAEDFDKASWNIVSKMRHVMRAIILSDGDTKLSEDVRLLVDIEADIDAPRAVHFMIAARHLRSITLTEAEATRLAAQPLRRVRLAMQRGRPVARVLGNLARAAARPLEKGTSDPQGGPSLHDLAGYGAAKDWGLRLARDFGDWRAGRIEWEDVDRGILLNGPPGSGKTTYAAALANTCGIPLVVASAARWQAEGHLGDMLKAMRKFFDSARKTAPCIAFIDEFDSFGDRATRADSEHHDYKRQVINGLLECLDPSGGREGVVVVGATNNASAIDAALLRPGRLEKVIEISLPDAAARTAIFRYHLGDRAEDLNLDTLMDSTRGWSGADLAKLARDAKRNCRHRRGDRVNAEDISSAMPVGVELTDEQRFRVAVHEAGHAVLGVLLAPENFVRVRLEAGRSVEGEVAQLGITEFRRAIPLMATEKDYSDRIAILFGGLVAEKLVFGNHSSGAGGHASSDLASATGLATMMERSFGFGSSLVTDGSVDLESMQRFRMYDPQLSLAVHKRLQVGMAQAYKLLGDMKDTVVIIAHALIAELELDVTRVCGLAKVAD